MAIKDLREKLQLELKGARDICDLAEKETRDFSAEERTKVAGHLESAGKIKAQIKTAEGDLALRAALGDFSDMLVPERQQLPGVQSKGSGSIGERFLQAMAYQEWYKKVAPNGILPDSAKGIMSPPVEFKTLITGDSDTSAGAFVQTDYTGIYEPLGRRPLTLRDLISQRVTGSDIVSYVRQTSISNAATPVAESNVTTYAGSTGQVEGKKPESAFAFETVTETVKTLAVWVPATKRALSDASQIRGIIDQELRADLEEHLEELMLEGDGTGEEFTGIFNTTNTLTQAWDTDILKTTRKAITNLWVNGRSQATAWLMNPTDWETIDLLTNDDGDYMFGGPMRMGVKTLWGIPVVESQAVTQGVGLLGNFKKAVLWDREQASVQVSDSHADFFIRNMLAFLAEMRAAFGVIRPTAFVEVELEATT